MALPADKSHYLWSYYFFANLPLQALFYACPAPTDEVDCLRGSCGNRKFSELTRHRKHHPNPQQQHFVL
jgi:hypothetical protein